MSHGACGALCISRIALLVFFIFLEDMNHGACGALCISRIAILVFFVVLEDMSDGACGAPFISRIALLTIRPIVSIMSGRLSRTIYIGNLPLDIRKSEIEDLFYKYGRIVEIELKNPPRPPGYCFVEFESSRDAEDAIRGRDGCSFDGQRLRVELAHGGRGQSSSFGGRGQSSSFGRSSGYGGGGASKHGVSRHSEYRVVVHGLPSSASWQDLKDHMRQAGEVCFVQVFRDGDGAMGLVDYTNYDDMKYAVRKLDDTQFKNPFARSYIRVRIYEGSQSPSRSRSRSPRRGRSNSIERPLSRSRSPRSRSASPARLSRSRSHSRSE